MSECGKCHGTGKVVCPECNGDTNVLCSTCEGKGKHVCSECSGHGKVRCKTCHGSGYEVFNCPDCHGRGTIRKKRRRICKHCGGTGIKPGGGVCPYCHHTGRVDAEEYDEKCTRCSGKGILRTENPCERCKGAREVACYTCHGAKIVNCIDCSGTGKCKKCKGTGKVKCPDCEKREREERNRRIAEREKKEAAEKAAKERKDFCTGCGCLLALITIVGFFVWWWWEGFTMAALPGMWGQVKNALGGGSLETIPKFGGAVVVALLIVWSLVKGIKGKKGEVSTSSKKRWKFVVLGLLLGFFGIHLAYAKRWLLFLLLWTGFITGNVMSGPKANSENVPAESTSQQVQTESKPSKGGSSPISGIGFGIWALLWIGGTLFIKKDGKGDRM